MTLLEGILDTPLWRALERGQLAVRRNRSKRQRGRALSQPMVCRVMDDDRAAPEEIARALDAAGDAGASDIATRLAERIVPVLARLKPATRAAAIAAQVELSISLGENDRARALAQEHFDVLAATARGATSLDVLDQRQRLVPFLPDGRPNFFALGHAITRGTLDGAQLLSILRSRPQLWITKPELHLLALDAFVSNDLERAGRFLNRFLRAGSLPACRVDSTAENLLAQMAFVTPRRVDDGPLVSIIVAAFNASHTLRYAIDSLLGQTYRRIEILVADDASTDTTAEILRSAYGGEPRVRLFDSASNQGPYNLRNALIPETRGSYITFHDADDLALPTRIERQVRALEESDAVACSASWLRMTAPGHVVFFRNQTATRLSLVSLMLRRHVLEEIGGERGPYRAARFGADQELYEDVRAQYSPARVVRLREPLIFGLWSDGSLTRAAGAESLETGYRSPSRRLYSELIFRKHCRGSLAVTEEEIAERLAAAGNQAAPLPITESGDRR